MKSAVDPAILSEIWTVIQERACTPSDESYTRRLLTDPKGIDKVLEKVGEESTEFIIAAVTVQIALQRISRIENHVTW